MNDVTDIVRDLEDTAQRVKKAADRLYRLTVEVHGGIDQETGEVIQGVESKWQDAHDAEIIAIESEAIANAVRPPAADIRQALARQKARDKNPTLYADYLRLTAEVEALQRWIATNKSVVSALQSVLRGERD
jgi:NADPH-dependent ferric siderophore reductase